MALADQVSLAEDIPFQKAVRQVIMEAARGYINAGRNTPATLARYALAREVVVDGGIAKLTAFVYGYSAFNTLTAANYATNIFGFSPKVWNTLAGLPEDTV